MLRLVFIRLIDQLYLICIIKVQNYYVQRSEYNHKCQENVVYSNSLNPRVKRILEREVKIKEYQTVARDLQIG